MVDEAIINLTKGEVHAKRGEWSKVTLATLSLWNFILNY